MLWIFSVLLHFHVNVIIVYQFLLKNLLGFFYWDCIKSLNQFQDNYTLTVLSVPNCNHFIFLCLFVFFKFLQPCFLILSVEVFHILLTLSLHISFCVAVCKLCFLAFNFQLFIDCQQPLFLSLSFPFHLFAFSLLSFF